MSVADVASRLKISMALVYALIATGSLPHLRLGKPGHRGCIRIAEADLDAFIEQLKQKKGQPAVKPAAPKPHVKTKHIILR
jgi:excisionase family DNA binding protein